MSQMPDAKTKRTSEKFGRTAKLLYKTSGQHGSEKRETGYRMGWDTGRWFSSGSNCNVMERYKGRCGSCPPRTFGYYDSERSLLSGFLSGRPDSWTEHLRYASPTGLLQISAYSWQHKSVFSNGRTRKPLDGIRTSLPSGGIHGLAPCFSYIRDIMDRCPVT